MAKTDHVVFDARMSAFHCQSCDPQYRPTLPSPIAVFVAAGKAFTKIHAHCPKIHGWKKPEGWTKVDLSEKKS